MFNIGASFQSILTQQLAQEMALRDTQNAYRAYGGKINNYNTTGNDVSELTKWLSALSIISSVFPFASGLINGLSGLFKGIADAKVKSTPLSPGQKSSVADQNLKAQQKDLMKQFEDNIQNGVVDKKLLAGNGSTEGRIAKLIFAAQGQSPNIKPGNVKVKNESVKGFQNPLSGLKGKAASTISVDNLNNEINTKINFNSNSTKLEPFVKNEKLSGNGQISLEDIATEIKNAEAYAKSCTSAMEAYKPIIDQKAFTISDLNSKSSTIAVNGQNYAYQESGYPQGITEEADKKTYDKGRQQIKEKLEKLNKDLTALQEQAKKEQKEIEAQQEIITEYQANLESIDIDMDQKVNPNMDVNDPQYMKALNDGKEIKSAKDFMNALNNEQERAIEILNQVTGEKYTTETIPKGMELDPLWYNKVIQDKLNNMYKESDSVIQNNQNALQLLDFATEGNNDLAFGSNISKAQHRDLQNKAAELIANGQKTGKYDFSELQKYANQNGITLANPLASDDKGVADMKHNNKTSDSNNNGITDNYTTKANKGVSVADFANSFEEITEQNVKDILGEKTTEISASDAEKFKKHLVVKSSDFEPPRMGVLGESKTKQIIINHQNDDKIGTWLDNSEIKSINKDVDKAIKNRQETVKKMFSQYKDVKCNFDDKGTVTVSSNMFNYTQTANINDDNALGEINTELLRRSANLKSGNMNTNNNNKSSGSKAVDNSVKITDTPSKVEALLWKKGVRAKVSMNQNGGLDIKFQDAKHKHLSGTYADVTELYRTLGILETEDTAA